ncbi:Fe(2+) transporter permease subunit FeoB [Spartinivicinus poritis]|uniref:Ferrous iron transport protein B n=1 Tax=Spartinivicinus poritis TaxID=2994640 RepID=A0ABT5U943_9GAMM|nr:Fe(2+) transporter permease subunit FeoB [Spartinivicinus sp. A2-2]MDE1462894.1 Fe(2+) transporter permease subunit FeoB [Spartinivicinus sp. A2-2]
MSLSAVCLVGNPNCGKTSLFNALTGSRQKIGNWPGVTVEKKTGSYQYNQQTIKVIDLPGLYSLDGVENTAIDEQITLDYLLTDSQSLIINTIDAVNLQRSLYLTLQLLELGKPMIIVLNMMDKLASAKQTIDIKQLAQQLKCPVLPIIAKQSKGLPELKKLVAQALKQPTIPLPPQPYNKLILQAIQQIRPDDHPAISQWQAINLLANNEINNHFPAIIHTSSTWQTVLQQLAQEHTTNITQQMGEDLDILIANDRYQFINQLTQQVVATEESLSISMTEKIDNIVLNRILGIPIFLSIMYLMFMFSINIGSAFIDFFDITAGTLFVDTPTYWLSQIHAPNWLITLLANGIGGGIQTVATFIPIIACLFLFLALLEGSGYMARAAFIMDKIMSWVGLPGKAFVPMLIGFGCNVPAVMATRTLESQRDRLLTICMTPFMSCGARLPVYALFAVAFFPDNGQNIVFILYLVGILLAIMTGIIMKHTLLPGISSPFILELPDYHLPTANTVLAHTWSRLKGFIVKAGKIIIVMVALLNVLNSLGTDATFNNENTEKSVLTAAGKALTPLFEPMGINSDNWPATVGIFTGVFAKEAVVGTLDAMYSQLNATTQSLDTPQPLDFWQKIYSALLTIPINLVSLADGLDDPLGMNIGETTNKEIAAEEQAIAAETFSTIHHLFGSPHAAFAYVLFILLYTPCLATLGAIFREANTSWMWLVAGWTLAVAYTTATVYYQIATFAEHPHYSIGWLVTLTSLWIVVLMLLKRRVNKLTIINQHVVNA